MNLIAKSESLVANDLHLQFFGLWKNADLAVQQPPVHRFSSATASVISSGHPTRLFT